MIPQSVFEQIREYGQKYGRSGVEIGGEIQESGEVLMVENISDSPTNTYEIAARSWLVAAHWHTHPNVPDFSGADIEYAKAMALPEIMYCPRYDVMKFYDPATGSIEQIYFPTTQNAFRLTESHQQKILRFVDRYGYSGEEIAGIITPNGDVQMLPNTASDPVNHFQIDWGTIPAAAVWHTHLEHHPAKLSESDIAEASRLGLPYVMYHIGQRVWDIYCPSSAVIARVASAQKPEVSSYQKQALKYQKQIELANAEIRKHNERYALELAAANRIAARLTATVENRDAQQVARQQQLYAKTNSYQQAAQSRAKQLAEIFRNV